VVGVLVVLDFSYRSLGRIGSIETLRAVLRQGTAAGGAAAVFSTHGPRAQETGWTVIRPGPGPTLQQHSLPRSNDRRLAVPVFSRQTQALQKKLVKDAAGSRRSL